MSDRVNAKEDRDIALSGTAIIMGRYIHIYIGMRWEGMHIRKWYIQRSNMH